MNNNKDLNFKFYVLDDLNGRAPHVTRYTTFDSALSEFESLDCFGGKTPALGVAVPTGGIDLLHKVNGDNVLVKDYLHTEQFSNELRDVIDSFGDIGNKLINEGIAHYRYCHSIVPWRDYSVKVIVPVEAEFKPDSYCNDKILKAGEGIPATAINEILIDGDGWVNYKDFLDDPSKYGENGALKVEMLNVAYVNSDKLVGVDGQMDLSIDNFEAIAEKINKPYYISVSDKEHMRYNRSNFAVMSFDTLPEAVKAWYEVNDKVEFTPGVMDRKAGYCVFNGCHKNFEKITYEQAAEIYGFDKVENVDNLISGAKKAAEIENSDVQPDKVKDIEYEK